MTASAKGIPKPAMQEDARSFASAAPRIASRPRMLYAGNLGRGQTSLQRLHAFEQLGCTITAVHTAPPGLPPVRRLFERIRRRVRGPRDWTDANRQILEWITGTPFDVLWIDKGLTITAQTLRRVKQRQPGCRILGFSPDDMYQRHNQSPQFREHLPLYDLFFTTKTFGVTELRSIGCPRVAFHHNGYDPDTHRPLALSDEERARFGGPVGFVGTWEPARAASIGHLVAGGVPVRVWGARWANECQPHPNLRIESRELLCLDYARALNSFDINLCFLRKLNRDRQTTRSVEIPACGAFMLAERTDEHLALFNEGVEAEFFASDDEMLDKTRYYLAHPEARRRIATAGFERCRSGRYSYHERLLDMLTTAGVAEGGEMLDCG
jgi:spore maturation protein CgeB